MRALSFSLLLFLHLPVIAQQDIVKQINDLIQKHEAEAHLTFLASDEMKGRNVGTSEIDIAANYIRAQFMAQGSMVKPAPGTKEFFQHVQLLRQLPPTKAQVTIGKEQFSLKDNLLVMEGSSAQWNVHKILPSHPDRHQR